jgi:hypothetical protein
MADYPLTVAEIVFWLRSRAIAEDHGSVTLEAVRENHKNIPSVGADFDSQGCLGQIVAWVTGEFDFLILRRSDGTGMFFRNETIPNLGAGILDDAYREFLDKMTSTGSA